MTDTAAQSTTAEVTEEVGGGVTPLPPLPQQTQLPIQTQPVAVVTASDPPDTTNAPVHEGEEAQRAKELKGEPLNIMVRDQTGAGLQFKVRKNTKFEKVMLAFCQKKNYQMSQVRFLYDGERVQKHQTPQSVDMEEGDVIDCVIEQLGGGY